ncbi:MAG: radical SAM protein [Desulfobacteraceae bacterium]|nr:radical SAM protein [Desulfobacteraceae bacterium]
MKVNEIFYSIQGESLYAGRPCVFIRLTGCNLRCTYCDTTYAYEEGKEHSLKDIVRRISAYGCNLVEITGGEPLLQDETGPLVSHLLAKGFEVLLETNGSRDISGVDADCIKIVDIKCPSSGEHDKNDMDNLVRVSPADQLKFVIGDRHDYEFAKSVLAIPPPRIPRDHILFSPVHGRIPADELASWILEDRLETRLHLQLHKLIWPDMERGV